MQIRSVMTSCCLQLKNGKILNKQYLWKYWSSVLETWHHKCTSQKKHNDTRNAVAQRSFITQILADQLGIRYTESESIALSAFGAHSSLHRQLPMATINIVATNGEHIPVRVLVIEQIATPLQNRYRQQVQTTPHLRGLQIVHPVTSDKNFEISLLIGADHYLNNRVFLLRNYRLIFARRKFDVLKTNICPRSEASRANMLVLRTSNFQGATIRPIVPRHKHYCLYCPPLNFLPRASLRITLNCFQLSYMKTVKVQCKIW